MEKICRHQRSQVIKVNITRKRHIDAINPWYNVLIRIRHHLCSILLFFFYCWDQTQDFMHVRKEFYHSATFAGHLCGTLIKMYNHLILIMKNIRQIHIEEELRKEWIDTVQKFSHNEWNDWGTIIDKSTLRRHYTLMQWGSWIGF